MHHPAAIADPAGTSPRAWTALAFLCLAELVLVIDITATNVALPTIAAELGMGTTGTASVVTGYIVTFGGLMLLGGRLADRFGARRMLLVGLAVFVAASAVCGSALDGTTLVAARAVQGAGAALLSPAALAALTRMFGGASRTRALGVWAGIGALGFAAGLLFGGAMTAGPGWRWIFLANVPLGALVAIAFVALVPSAAPARVRVDVGGGLLATSATASFVAGLTLLGEGGAPIAFALLGAGVLALALFAAYERRQPHPLVRVAALRSRTVVGGLVAMLFASGIMVSTFYVASLELQRGLGMDALSTGLAFLPAALALVLSAHLAAGLILRFGPRPVGVAAFATAAGGLVVLAAVGVGSGSVAALAAGVALVCLGMGGAFVVATTSALSSVRHEDAGVTAGVVNTGHELGGAIGVAAATAAFGLAVTWGLPLERSIVSLALVVLAAFAAATLAATVFPAGRVDRVANPHGH